MRNLNLAAGIAACVMALSGCAEDTARDDTDTTGGANTTGGVNATNGGTNSTNGGTNATNGGTNAPNGGTNSTNAGTNSTGDGGSTGVAGGDAGDTTGAVGNDPGTPGNDSETAVDCGDATDSCDLNSKSCCVGGIFPLLDLKCNDGLTCSSGSRAICDGPEDCGVGESCCVVIEGIQGNNRCMADCGDNQQLCHSDDDCPGTSCAPGGTLQWWGICG